MRVKALAAAVGLSVVAAVALGQGVSGANRGLSNDPVAQPRIETPAEPVAETPAPPAEETTVPPAVDETPVPSVVEEPPAPEPTTETTTTTIPPVPATPPTAVEQPAAPVVDPVPVDITVTEKADPAPAAAPAEPAAPKAADPCHMDSYEPVLVADLSGGEQARAEKVDRNGNGTVCRKDIPGKGRGNTGENSNIKDDQAR